MTGNREDALNFDDLISVREAAKLLHVSESTIWRWIGKGIVPAYKVGPKRVCIRRAELKPLVNPMSTGQPVDLTAYMFPMNPYRDPTLTDEEVIARARALREKMLAERGGVPFPPSWIDINEARDERSEEL